MHFDTKQAENGLGPFEGIKEVVRTSSYVNIDETGWRVEARNCWLWVLVTDDAVLYVIDESRGSKVVTGILGDRYGGIERRKSIRDAEQLPLKQGLKQ